MSSNFNKIFPYLAEQIINDYEIEKGICLDIGTGPGSLGLEIAKISDLKVYLVDIDPEAIEKCRKNIKKLELDSQVIPVEMDVKNMDFPDNFADIIVSRGSIWFWDDRPRGLKEIYRVLKKGGIGFVGGGLRRNLPEKYRKYLAEERKNRKNDEEWIRIRSEDYFKEILVEAGIDSYRLIFDPPVGRWVEIHK
ncbi:MAG: class I SAM-dependent methyltransferase [Halanaerobiales bacterium]